MILTPVRVDPFIVRLDWLLLILVPWIATAFLWRGKVGRLAGVLLLLAYVISVILHVILH